MPVRQNILIRLFKIKAAQSSTTNNKTSFKKPEKVDDLRAVLKCKIPSLLNIRPEMYEKSISKLQKKKRHKGKLKRLNNIKQKKPLKLAIKSDETGRRTVFLPSR